MEFFAGCDYVGDRAFVSLDSGERFEVPADCRIVDARYLSPDIPAESPPRFGVVDGAQVIPVNDLVRSELTPSQYVVVGSGKTATDASSGCCRVGRTPTPSAGSGRGIRGC